MASTWPLLFLTFFNFLKKYLNKSKHTNQDNITINNHQKKTLNPTKLSLNQKTSQKQYTQKYPINNLQ